jgi:antitoxin Phd
MANRRKTKNASLNRRSTAGLERLEKWKLEDAKARFSEVVRLASVRGPQLVTVRGKEAAVILSPREFQQMYPAQKKKPLVDFLQGLRLREIPLVREPDTGRDIVL